MGGKKFKEERKGTRHGEGGAAWGSPPGPGMSQPGEEGLPSRPALPLLEHSQLPESLLPSLRPFLTSPLKIRFFSAPFTQQHPWFSALMHTHLRWLIQCRCPTKPRLVSVSFIAAPWAWQVPGKYPVFSVGEAKGGAIQGTFTTLSLSSRQQGDARWQWLIQQSLRQRATAPPPHPPQMP